MNRILNIVPLVCLMALTLAGCPEGNPGDGGGSQTIMATVPDLTGMTRSQAETAVTAANLTIGTVGEAFSATVAPGYVLSQSPAADTSIAEGSAINLTLSSLSGSGAAVVPDLLGLTQSQAQTAIVAAGLLVGNVNAEYNSGVKEGYVITQAPAAESTIEPGRTVSFTISLGVKPVSVPSIGGMTRASAMSTLTDASLVAGDITQVYHATAPSGYVISQDPAAYTQVAPNTPVSMVLSLGPEPVTVPNFHGMSRSAVESQCDELNFSITSVLTQYDDSATENTIMDQDLDPGSSVLPGAEINLTMSLGARQEARFTLGTDTLGDPVSITEYGVTIQGGDGTPVEDVTLVVPVGTVKADTNVSLGYNDGMLTNLIEGTPGGASIVIDADEVTAFDKPIQVYFSYASKKKASGSVVPVVYRINDDGSLHLMTLTLLDRGSQTATFETFAPGRFTWVLSEVADVSDSFITQYVLGDDGFQSPSSPSSYNAGGQSFGMSTFSLWYYTEKSASYGELYSRFMQSVGNDGMTGQMVIATRAQNALHSQITHYYSTVFDERFVPTAQEQLASIQNALRNTANPVAIGLGSADSVNYAALVTGYMVTLEDGDVSETMLLIYDPAQPGVAQNIGYDVASAEWEAYGNYSVKGYVGDGSFSKEGPFSQILSDAESGFSSSDDATISGLYPTTGSQVLERSVQLSGSVQSGGIEVTELTIFVEGMAFTPELDESNGFAQDIPIGSGANEITFETRGVDAQGNDILINNNMTSEQFTLSGVLQRAAILVTLTWDKNDTDVDLYVIDPNGDYSCYYNYITEDGGELDLDDVDGYGPEHWTLSYSDTVRYGEDYRIRAHYYSDHGNGPTNYTVTIVLNEGTSAQSTAMYQGTLSYSDWGNTGPTDVGTDWADIATVSPSASGKALIIPADPEYDGQPIITVPIPSQEEQLAIKELSYGK